MSKAIVDSLRIGPEKNFCYIILCPVTGKIGLIDPSFDFEKVKAWVEKTAHAHSPLPFKVTHLLATHGHWDHAGGFNEMLKIYPDAKVTAHKTEEPRLQDLGIPLHKGLSNDETFKIGNVGVTAMHTAGHTIGGCCYIVDDQIFTGDTLFIGQCGRTDLKGGSDKDLFLSLQKLKKLDPRLSVRPGHDYGPTPYAVLESELRTNPTLLASTLEDFISLP